MTKRSAFRIIFATAIALSIGLQSRPALAVLFRAKNPSADPVEPSVLAGVLRAMRNASLVQVLNLADKQDTRWEWNRVEDRAVWGHEILESRIDTAYFFRSRFSRAIDREAQKHAGSELGWDQFVSGDGPYAGARFVAGRDTIDLLLQFGTNRLRIVTTQTYGGRPVAVYGDFGRTRPQLVRLVRFAFPSQGKFKRMRVASGANRDH